MNAFVPDLVLRSLRTYGNKAAREAALVVIENKTGIDELNHAVSLDNKKLKNASIKTLRLVSEAAPKLTYKFIYYYDFLLDSPDNILKWNATFIIANHAAIDHQNRIDKKIVDKFINQLHDNELITAANTASCIWKIAKFKPQFREIITANLVKIDLTKRDEECKAILAGKAIRSLDQYWSFMETKEGVMDFMKRQTKSPRNATIKKAEKFIELHRKEMH